MKQKKRDFNTDLYFQTVEIKKLEKKTGKKDWKKRLKLNLSKQTKWVSFKRGKYI